MGRERTVLVVDDDASLRRLLAVALPRHGWRVEEADGRVSALDHLAGGLRVDAVLIDGLLSDGRGIDLADQLITDPATASLPLCFLSGALSRDVPAVAGIACMRKPASMVEIAAELERLAGWRPAPDDDAGVRQSLLAELRGQLIA